MKHFGFAFACALTAMLATHATISAADQSDPAPLVLQAAPTIQVLPQPRVVQMNGAVSVPVDPHLVMVFIGVKPDLAAEQILYDRWKALRIVKDIAPHVQPDAFGKRGHYVFARFIVSLGTLTPARRPLQKYLGVEGYFLSVNELGARIESDSAAGRFYGLMTLAQLARPAADGRWYVPAVRIVDWPALRWRGLSDDVSHGPVPTMAFFKKRIRMLAAFKGNLYTPYMVDTQRPRPALEDAMTPAELAQLSAYAASYHVTVMPEQETLDHGDPLALERYANMARPPQDQVLPAAGGHPTASLRDEAVAVHGRSPFIHVGGEEPSWLGTARSSELLSRSGADAPYGEYFASIWSFVRELKMRPVIWGDYLLGHPTEIRSIPKDVVVANRHYDDENSFLKYLRPFAESGLQQFVVPGAANWDQIYPDTALSARNVSAFVRDGQNTPGVIGMLDTVRHDDGQSLFASTWYPVVFALSAAWQPGMADERTFHKRFDFAFFGATDDRLARDLDALQAARQDLATKPLDDTDYQFWLDPFAGRARLSREIDARKLRFDAQAALQDLETHPQPALNQDALPSMRLAAMRYDLLGRKLQIAREFDGSYADAVANAGRDDDKVYSDLYYARYLLQEWRDELLSVRRAYAKAWRLECRPAYLADALSNYDVWSADLTRLEGRLSRVINEDYLRHKSLPPRAELFAGLAVGNE